MTALVFFGCAFTTFGPAFWLFVFTIARDPVKIIVLILSAFLWLLSLLLSSLLWLAVVPLRDQLAFGLVFAVIFQEAFRVGTWLLFKKADRVLRKITENEDTKIFSNKHTLAYVVGLGFGLMSGLMSHVNVLADSLGPGTVGWAGESSCFFMVSSLLCLALILCHACWGVITFTALDQNNWIALAYVWMAHMTFSCVTLVNTIGLYPVSLLVTYLVLVVSACLAFHLAGGNFARLKAAMVPRRQQAAGVTTTTTTAANNPTGAL